MSNNDILLANEFVEEGEIEMSNSGRINASSIAEDIYSNYELLEYIQSSGTQYINTGYVPKGNFIVSLDMMWTGTSVSAFESFAGFMHANTVPRAGMHKYSGTFMIGGDATISAAEAPVANERMVCTAEFISGSQKFYKNSVLLISSNSGMDLSANTQQVYIFGRNASSKNLTSMRLYGGKIYNGTKQL
jgi:hypothetical protein